MRPPTMARATHRDSQRSKIPRGEVPLSDALIMDSTPGDARKLDFECRTIH